MSRHPDTLRIDPDERRAPPRRPAGPRLFALAVAVALAVAAGFWWLSLQRAGYGGLPVAPTEPPTATAPVVATQGPRHPIDLAPGEQPLAAPEIAPALATLLGQGATEAQLQTDGFPRRVVATVDNLGREYAPASLWPVAATPGRFQVEQLPGGGTAIAPSNAGRYAPFVRLADSLDAGATVQLYRRMYPLLQAAYGELGFPGRHLNDRVVEVIDLLLATPEPAQPPRVQLTEVRGPVPAQRPWVRYEFVDPRLQSLAAGQKILVRVGPEHARVLKGKLAQLKEALLAPVPAPAR